MPCESAAQSHAQLPVDLIGAHGFHSQTDSDVGIEIFGNFFIGNNPSCKDIQARTDSEADLLRKLKIIDTSDISSEMNRCIGFACLDFFLIVSLYDNGRSSVDRETGLCLDLNIIGKVVLTCRRYQNTACCIIHGHAAR